MLKDISYQQNEKSIIDVERAITELRRGAIILLKSDDKTYLIAAMEALTDRDLTRFAAISSPLYLLITANRATYLLAPQTFSHSILIRADGKSLIELQTLAGIDTIDPKPQLTAPTIQADNSTAAAINLAKLAELLPSVLISTVEESATTWQEWAARNGIHCVDSAAIDSYKKNISTSLLRGCDAPLCLDHAEHTHITAYRPITGGKEHYAIIVGDPSNSDAPLVRIHSSCYTGDILASLRCDCGDQLRSAIEFMGKTPAGGIILYLMQEGRGIGLSNKLRTYALQETGIDTVDANEMLGFEADERLFLPAAEMLKEMGYTKIRLLTNNFRKSKGLESYGIEVAECVPHIIEAHQFNDQYLKTKATRLGHKLSK